MITFPINHPYPDNGDIATPLLNFKKMLVVTLFSKQVKTKEGEIINLVTCEGNQKIWSNEPMRGGLIIDVTARKAGEKYVDRDGVEQTVKTDGLNYNGMIGTAVDARNIALAMQAKKEIDL